MIFYDWNLIRKKAKGVSGPIIDMLSVMHRKQKGEVFAKWRYDPFKLYYDLDLRGTSFLINPGHLLKNRYKHPDKDIATYIGLAAFRSYVDYKYHKIRTLDLSLSPLTQQQLEKNTLLRIKDNKIHFYYEEADPYGENN